MPQKSINKKTDDSIPKLLSEAKNCIKVANKHRKSLNGNNSYANKFVDLRAKSILLIRALSKTVRNENTHTQESIKAISYLLEDFFNPTTEKRSEDEKEILFIYKTQIEPLINIEEEFVPNGDLFPLEIISGTRGYIEEIGKQANGCFEKGWYDASAVMIRRLLETLIIECFEKLEISDLIKGKDGNFLFLKDLIDIFLKVTKWNISRNSKIALPKLKEVGDLSAHSRRYIAKKPDMLNLQKEIRLVIQELVYIADFNNAISTK